MNPYSIPILAALPHHSCCRPTVFVQQGASRCHLELVSPAETLVLNGVVSRQDVLFCVLLPSGYVKITMEHYHLE